MADVTVTGSLTIQDSNIVSANEVRVLGNGKITLIYSRIGNILGEGIYLADNATLACPSSHLGRFANRGKLDSWMGKLSVKSYDQV